MWIGSNPTMANKSYPSPAVAQAPAGLGIKPNWSKLDCDERIERLREVVKQIREDVRYLERCAREHTHSEHGHAVLPVDTYDHKSKAPEPPNDEVYL